MKIVNLESWESFEKEVSKFFDAVQKIKTEKHPFIVSTPIFRGHANASWKLQTTLERFTERTFGVEDYYWTMQSVRPAVVSITEKNWDLPESIVGAIPPTGYAFMVYLRHHGFPSPLLDWTRSPFVAAFFAFRSREKQTDDRVAIYSYVEWRGDAKHFQGQAPRVHGLGPYVVSHKRHYAQQCEYTICRKKVDENYEYSSHEAAFLDNKSDQGALTKYTLPVSERTKALKQLYRMNVTTFSLFGSEESLMDTLAYKEIEDLWSKERDEANPA